MQPSSSSKEEVKPKKCSINPMYKKYFKLKKMHMPVENLKIKMQLEGLDPSVIDQEEPVWDEEEPPQESNESENERPPLAALLAAKLSSVTLRPVSEKQEASVGETANLQRTPPPQSQAKPQPEPKPEPKPEP